MKRITEVTVAVAAIILFTQPAQSASNPIAYDLMGSSSQNLIQHTNHHAFAFSSSADGFQKYQRLASASIPFSLMDDSLANFPADSLGIIDERNLDQFFGVTDTANGDNPTGEVVATWDFDINNQQNLTISIDMAAMGDFETADYFTWKASIDGGTEQVLFTSTVDEAGSASYVLAGGASYTLNDPMMIDGVALSNTLQTFSTALLGNGTILTLTLQANADGGSEAFAFQNIVIAAEEAIPPMAEVTPIHAIQGTADVSPLAGEIVTVEAIVVGDFQNNGITDSGDLRGFYLQEEDADVDANTMTSEGIFVFDTGRLDVQMGDQVRVTGQVSEYFGMTQIAADTVERLAGRSVMPSVAELTLPVSSADAFEAYEGMSVRFNQALVISEYYNFDRYGEIVLAEPLAGESRPMAPTTLEAPGSVAYQQRANDNRLARITLDDGRTEQNPDPAYHPNGQVFDLNNRFRGGDLLQNAVGVMDYRYDKYRLQPTMAADYIVNNPRPLDVPYVGGSLKIAAFNVLNYFTTLDQPGHLCGPDGNLNCRGADNADEFTRQRDKIISAIAAMDADIVGLIEIENNATAAVNDLVDGLNLFVGEARYAALNTGTIGSDAIKVGFIYQPATVQTIGDFAVLDSLVDARFIDDKNRPALAQTFTELASGARLTVVVNHLKSKGSDCTSLGDPDLGDGQGNCNIVRTQAAHALAQWLATDPTASNDDKVLIIGDLNAYAKEDPIRALTESGYTDLLRYYQGDNAYSYVFDGQFGYLDYALSNAALRDHVTGTAVWHINADEPDILDYDSSYKKTGQAALYEANPYRSSDHDPVIIGLDLHPTTSQQISVMDLDANVAWLGPNKWGAAITIHVKDEQGALVKGVSVNGDWYGKGQSRSASCTTDANGACSVTLVISGEVFQLAFAINGLSHENMTYDPAANSDVNGDSDGTAITVYTIALVKQTLLSWLQEALLRMIND